MRTRAGTTIDLTGEVFGLLTVVDRAPNDVFGRVYWACICRCGTPCKKTANQLRAGKFFTCGKPECRFWEKVYIPEGDSCHEWTGALTDQGYGAFKVGEKKVPAHVFVWTLKHGPVPTGMVVRHKVCDFRACVREDHLLIGTHQDNMRDMVEKGRSKASRPRLSGLQRSGMLVDAQTGLTHVEIAYKYRTTTRTVNRVVNGH